MRASLPFLLLFGVVAFGCANEAPAAGDSGERAKTVAVITVDRTDPASPDAPGNASAIARFVSVPAFTDANRVLVSAGATAELPAAGGCQTADAPEEVDGAQTPVEFVEAGEVSLVASGVTTPLVPHAFPAVGTFASGVLYTTRDRESGALPSSVPYQIAVSGSPAMAAFHTVADAPKTPATVQIGRLELSDVESVQTTRPIEISWEPGEPTDTVYVELVSYDGAPGIVCTFHDKDGSGQVPEGVFSGAGAGRIALHRLRTRHIDAQNAGAGEIRFDFQVGASVDFSR
jgi:hypothetical protein